AKCIFDIKSLWFKTPCHRQRVKKKGQVYFNSSFTILSRKTMLFFFVLSFFRLILVFSLCSGLASSAFSATTATSTGSLSFSSGFQIVNLVIIDQFNHGHFSLIALSSSQFDHSGISTRSFSHFRRNFPKQFR